MRNRGRSCWSADQLSCFDFFASNRTFVSVDKANLIETQTLQNLCRSGRHHSCVDDQTGFIDLEAAKAANPSLVVIELPFGKGGPWANYLAPDIVAGALGGAAATTGDVDTPPLKNFGDLNFMSGAYVAIAALSALHHQRTSESKRQSAP